MKRKLHRIPPLTAAAESVGQCLSQFGAELLSYSEGLGVFLRPCRGGVVHFEPAAWEFIAPLLTELRLRRRADVISPEEYWNA